MHLRVISPGALTTVQDLGRVGYERFGVPQSGAMDWFALRGANSLVGNLPGAAGFEFALDAPILQAEEDGLIAAAGWGWYLVIQGRRVGPWRAARVFRGEQITFTAESSTGWGYLAVRGGIEAPRVMGSRSTYLRGGFGGWHGRLLRQEDVLPVGGDVDPRMNASPDGRALAGRWLPPGFRPAYPAGHSAGTGAAASIPVILGPQAEAFSAETLALFLASEYTVSATSDRMGYRLAGPRLVHQRSPDLISEPVAWGSVQVPADGQPIVMLSDRQTAGGYPKIATVALAGLPPLVQAMPGSGRVRFEAVTVAEAQSRCRAMQQWLDTGIIEDDVESFSSFF